MLQERGSLIGPNWRQTPSKRKDIPNTAPTRLTGNGLKHQESMAHFGWLRRVSETLVNLISKIPNHVPCKCSPLLNRLMLDIFGVGGQRKDCSSFLSGRDVSQMTRIICRGKTLCKLRHSSTDTAFIFPLVLLGCYCAKEESSKRGMIFMN
jgi:hypothetical protein